MSNLFGGTASVPMKPIDYSFGSIDDEESGGGSPSERVSDDRDVGFDGSEVSSEANGVSGRGVVSGRFIRSADNSTYAEDPLQATGQSPHTTPAKHTKESRELQLVEKRKRKTEDLEGSLLSKVLSALVEKTAIDSLDLISESNIRSLDVKHISTLTHTICEALGIANLQDCFTKSVVKELKDYATRSAKGTLHI